MPTEVTETETKPVPGSGSAGQTFLIGDNIYLRGVELGDAKYPLAWRDNPYPISAERAEEVLKEEIPKLWPQRKNLLIACRRRDDQPVGSVTYSTGDWRTTSIDVRANPMLGAAAGAVKAEILELVVPWFIQERDLMVVWADMASDEPELMAAAERAGMVQTSRIREFFGRNGVRHDLLTYEILHPTWIERLGDPRQQPIERTGTGQVRPVPAPVTIDGDPPPKAIMVGQRVYLRPVEKEDADIAARWSRQETETFFDQGRGIDGPIGWHHFHKELQEKDPPSWTRFSICLRETDEPIGQNGVLDIDWLHKTAETESFIHRPDYRGGGYGSEAKHLLLEYAFDRIGLHMIRSWVWMPNTRSAAALRKQGYRDAGRVHWDGLKDGQFTGGITFDLLAAEWRALRAKGT